MTLKDRVGSGTEKLFYFVGEFNYAERLLPIRYSYMHSYIK